MIPGSTVVGERNPILHVKSRRYGSVGFLACYYGFTPLDMPPFFGTG
ncbi:MAG: hypothetical protein GXP60_05010 [Epsilonproteobacteria bacterium]|nr:hypothetical protein [Campylobacterota bacterium]